MTYLQEIALTLMERAPVRQADLIAVSEHTLREVRRDLQALCAAGVVRYTRGWWMLAGYTGPMPDRAEGETVRAPRPRASRARRVVRPEPIPPTFAPAPLAAPPLATRRIGDVEFEVVWSGRGSLVGEVEGMGSSLVAAVESVR